MYNKSISYGRVVYSKVRLVESSFSQAGGKRKKKRVDASTLR